jgi:metal-sulfur cluster biosynthetic enzyme
MSVSTVGGVLRYPGLYPEAGRAYIGHRCGAAAALGKEKLMVTEKDVRRALRKVKDPELNLDLVVLGLVYDIEVQETYVKATISLTSPFCPVAGQIIEDAKAAIEAMDGVDAADVELTFSPPWTPERIDPLIRATLGL